MAEIGRLNIRINCPTTKAQNHDTITGLRLSPGPNLVSQSIPVPRKWAIGFDLDGPIHDQLSGFGDVPYRYGGEATNVYSDPDPSRNDAATVGDVSRPLADQFRQEAYFRGESGRVPMNFAGFSGGWASKEAPLWLFKDFQK